MGFRPHLSFCAYNTAWLASELLVSMGPSPPVWIMDAKQRLLFWKKKSLWVPDITRHFVHTNQRDFHKNDKSIWVPTLICGFCMQNSDFWTSIQVSMGTRPHQSFCAYKTTWLAPELLVSMGSSPHLWFCAFKIATLRPKLHASMGLRPHLSFCACNTVWLATELLVSMGSNPHLWFYAF